MPTSTLELNVDWSVFDTNQRVMIEKVIEKGFYNEIAALLVEVTPAQVVEIEKIQRQLRPQSFKFESQAQKDFEIWSTTNFNDITPEKAQEWQQKIDAEKEEKLQAINGGLVEPTSKGSVSGESEMTVTMSNELNGVKGLGETSIKRLNAVNIYSVDELRAMPQDKRKEVLGPLVAAKIKSLI